MPGFRRLLERLDEFVLGIPNRDITPEHFDTLDPDAQQSLQDHVANNPHPIFEQDDSVTDAEPEVVPVAEPQPESQPEPQPEPATSESQQDVPQSVEIPDAESSAKSAA